MSTRTVRSLVRSENPSGSTTVMSGGFAACALVGSTVARTVQQSAMLRTLARCGGLGCWITVPLVHSGAIVIWRVPRYAPARAELRVAPRITIVRLALALGPLLQNWWLAPDVKPDVTTPATSAEPPV